jgi:uncharacterized membrane protein YtjA (UPF0391 family)
MGAMWNPDAVGSFLRGRATGAAMFKYAVIFLIISLVAGGVGLTNISTIARRVALIFFALFFIGFLALLGFAYLLGEAFNAGAHAMAVGTALAV